MLHAEGQAICRKSRAKPFGVLGLLLIGGLVLTPLAAPLASAQTPMAEAAATRSFGAIEVEAQSEFGLVRVRKSGSIRTMLFVQPSGKEVGQTRVNLQKPHELMIPYTQTMFASFLFKPEQQRVLIVGLGGGSMVHFLQYHSPLTAVDVVEINPVVVKLADEYFQVRSEGNVRVITADGLAFVRESSDPYDAIYMDAFLKPSSETDQTGRPLRLKTIEFFRTMQQKLTPDGVAVFNVNLHRSVAEDIGTLSEAFPQLYLFKVASKEEVVAVGTKSGSRKSATSLRETARSADRKFRANFTYQAMLRDLVTR